MSDHLKMIEEIELAVSEDEIHLTEWEDDRIQEWKGRGSLSERQEEILVEIWRRARP